MRSPLVLLQRLRAALAGGRGPLSAASAADEGGGSSLLACLPLELHMLLLEYLGPEDVAGALAASKVLRILWLSEDVWPRLADRWYPGLSGALRAREAAAAAAPTTRGGGGAVAGAGELFGLMLGRICARGAGRFTSVLHHSMHLRGERFFSLSTALPAEQGGVHSLADLGDDLPDEAGPGATGRFRAYRNGRVAWWPSSYAAPYIAVVDDLRTARRRVLRFPGHGGVQRGYKTALGDDMLVMTRDDVLHAWHLETDRLASVAVPATTERCIAEGAAVLVVTRQAELYLWRPLAGGGRLERVDVAALGCYQAGPVWMGGLLQPVPSPFQGARRTGLRLKRDGMLLDFILHPDAEGVMFAVTMHEGRLVVHEIKDGALVQSYPLHGGGGGGGGGEEDEGEMQRRWRGVNEYLRWEKCDPYGGYCLFSAYLGHDDSLSPSDLQSPGEQPICACGDGTGIVSVCFNIYTRSFRVTCHHHHLLLLPAGYDDPRIAPAAFHLWQDRLYTSLASPSMRQGWPVTALRSCIASLEGPPPGDSIPVFTSREAVAGSPVPRCSASFAPGTIFGTYAGRRSVELIEFGLDASFSHGPAAAVRNPTLLWTWDDAPAAQAHVIAGDGDFLLFVVEGVYMAWSFGDEIPGAEMKRQHAPTRTKEASSRLSK